MTLEMRTNCERCDCALSPSGPAHICSYECTWCTACAAGFEFKCPNCGGELVARPRRASELPPPSIGGDLA